MMMSNNDLQLTVKEIKQSFRLLMNGEASRYMRENGLGYHLNWGIAFTDLKHMAEQYGKDEHLAIELWKENIRECKILATLIMPAEKMTPQLADLWLEQTETLEIAQMLAFNLFRHLDFIPVLAFEWMASGIALRQICGFHIISRRLMDGDVLDDRGICEIIDQALTALSDESVGVRHAAYTCLQRMAEINDEFLVIVNKALKTAKLPPL